ncbi:PTS sugar transporter subunit IIB [Enorma phocaeensis]|uniref:PTS sugar transporter subunit IIB n=1 Tax=Enorma phocaeensis TaxID=1871019 RepID=A0ABT7V803_9ACTN|nr:PTS sugar transporter subunit IIB [Enorma phocaeensis]MDM8274621.1 PTS sugar transporter subunit IIB [Enorma phocaeensis]
MRKIVLFCAAGMSTSVMVQKMQEAADAQGYPCEIAAYSVAEVGTYGPDADMVLLGPQIRFNLNKVRKQLPKKPVEVIDMRAYGMMDGAAIIEFVKEKLGD